MAVENKLKIENCNCINHAELTIKPNTLNIKYGLNGTGKSTLSKAILYYSNQDAEELLKLKPYNSDEEPNLENCDFKNVRLFDESYVNKYLFENTSFLNNSYQVFLRDKDLDIMKNNTENLLRGLQSVFEESNDVKELMSFLPNYVNITSFKNGSISKRGGIGELLKGNGSGFDKYEELNPYKPFYEDRDFTAVSKWAKWRNDGINQMNGDSCPFCTHDMDKVNIERQNKTISSVFKSSALKVANEVLVFLQNGVEKGYINPTSVGVMKEYIGDSSKANELQAEMNQIGIETEYLRSKIEQIYHFKPMNVSREQIEEIELKLDNLIIDNRQISKFYSTDKINSLVEEVDLKIKELKEKTSAIKKMFLKCQEKMDALIENRKEDINNFFMIAGFPYKFVLKSSGENNATCYLVPNNAWEDDKIENPENHLSWGEKNAFSLVMFMFETVSDDSDLIVLDDPITSFDKNKKFAVTKRLFDNTNFSFRDKTVLMLTHDLQPVIDYVHGKFLRKYDLHTPVYASYLTNNGGDLEEQEIVQSDLKNVVELTECIAKDKSAEVPVRIINLRKYIELTNPDFSTDYAYDVLSNLIHGRNLDLYENRIENKNKVDVVNEGMRFINSYINDMEYGQLLNETSDKKLLELVKNSDKYTQTIAIRFLFEKDRSDGSLLSQLKKEYPNACKFVNETNHIENDYIFQLNPMRFFEIPEHYLNQLKEFCNEKLSQEK
ncbi:hypothetical protein CEP45_07370 [Mergibacter septicus]|uniref:hypothetical protein n=1 Tax=Mergibacter septicus TaxID=221402 RepID=UPI001C7745F6|nr:hypothetical protein [Mergibacter septicus]QDJ13675.1 hypothetical protein CEP45_07370 [Mergibacter septicus]